MHIERQRENIMPSVTVSQIKQTRTCPLCAKEDIKHLSDHLKGKHKMTSAKERTPHLKRPLMFQKAKTIFKGMDFLTDGLVRCQTCCISWDAKMSYKCRCGHYYNGPNRDNLDIKVNRETGLDFLENGLVRCQACHLKWDGNTQHECAYDAGADDADIILCNCI